MKVAEVKGIRLIMGAAKDERGSVFCNTKQWEVLWPLWSAGLRKCPLLGWICSGASDAVLYRLYGRDRLRGSEASKSVAQPFGRCSSIFPLETSGTWRSLKEAMTRVPSWCEGNPASVAERYMRKVWIWVWETIKKPIYVHKLTVLELCGIDSLPAALRFLPRVASVQNCEQVRANPC